MAEQSTLRRQNATRRQNPFTDAAAIPSTGEVDMTDSPTLNTLLPKGHKILTYSKYPHRHHSNIGQRLTTSHHADDSEQYATAAANLHNLKKAIYRAGYDKGYEQARQDAQEITDAHVEALLQMGRDLGWKEATDFMTAEKSRMHGQRIRNEEIEDRHYGDLSSEPIRAVHWYQCAKKLAKCAKAKVARKVAKRGEKAAVQDEKEYFGFCGR
jgi:hypothetical protein